MGRAAMKLVNAETLAAALEAVWYDTELHEAVPKFLAAIQPDPRLAALLVAARRFMEYPLHSSACAGQDDDAPCICYVEPLRDALAAFEEPV